MTWEGGAGTDVRYQQIDGQLTISNVDRNRDQGSWVCSVLTPGGELARRDVRINSSYFLLFFILTHVHNIESRRYSPRGRHRNFR